MSTLTASAQDSLLVDRLRRLKADGNLRHTAARWRAHEAAYPGMGAAEIAAGYSERDQLAADEIRATLNEFRSCDTDPADVAYLEWLLAEIEAA